MRLLVSIPRGLARILEIPSGQFACRRWIAKFSLGFEKLTALASNFTYRSESDNRKA